MRIRATAINTDATNHGFGNDYDRYSLRLGNLIKHELYPDQRMDFMTISELSPLDPVRRAIAGSDFAFEHATIGYDKIAIVYNARRWKPDSDPTSGRIIVTSSRAGKYILMGFTNRDNNEHLYYMGVHLPYKQKNKRNEAFNILRQTIDPITKTGELLIPGGDWNGPSGEVETLLMTNYLGLGFGLNGTVATTKAETSIDNILYPTNSMNVSYSNVYSYYTRFTHLPIMVTFNSM